jgi:Mor family transcriptional regulator
LTVSRALILRAQARFLKRPLTAEETTECLKAWADIAGAKIIRIPKPKEPQADLFNKAVSLRENGWSIRRIARKLQMSKSEVHRELSQQSAIPKGQDPA